MATGLQGAHGGATFQASSGLATFRFAASHHRRVTILAGVLQPVTPIGVFFLFFTWAR